MCRTNKVWGKADNSEALMRDWVEISDSTMERCA